MPEFVHALNRGTDKRKIFLDEQDYFRFINNLYEFNNQARKVGNFYLFSKSNDIGCRCIEEKPKEPLVEIHAFALMPNHYHLFLSSCVENGIPRFMQKIDMGYSKYFNLKYRRTGTLYEGSYKSIPVVQEAHFIHLPYYIHCNPLDLAFPRWRNREIIDHEAASLFLETYRWSSHLDYLGRKNFPSVTSRKFLLEFFDGYMGYRQKIGRWLKDMDTENMRGILLED